MNYGKVFDQTVRLMQDRLNLNSLNQKLVSSNLANINTPGYKAKELSFEQALRESLEEPAIRLVRSDQDHVDPSDTAQAMASARSEEIGAVDLELEMMKLTRNSIEYQFITTMLNKRFALLRQAIGEGGQ
jgi:flagellar basal-body rod protein FlgB